MVTGVLPAFDHFPVDLREYQGEPLVTSRGRTCPTVMRRPSYFDGWLSPRSGGRRIHYAVDIMAPQGSWVVSPLTMKVVKSTYGLEPSGLGGHAITLRHVDSGCTIYMCHFRDPPVFRRGDRVPSGALIGYVGRTGNAQGSCPHLHIAGARADGVKVNLYERLVAVDPFRGRRMSAPSSKSQSLGEGLPLVGTVRAYLEKRAEAESEPLESCWDSDSFCGQHRGIANDDDDFEAYA